MWNFFTLIQVHTPTMSAVHEIEIKKIKKKQYDYKILTLLHMFHYIDMLPMTNFEKKMHITFS